MHLALVGVGKVAVNNYLPYLAAQPDVTLAYYNRTHTRAEEAVVRFGGVACATLDALMATAPDAVLLLTRETVRAELLGQLLDFHPPRIFCEKPLVAAAGQAAVSEEDFWTARALYQRAQAQGTALAMVFNYRFFRHSRLAAQLRADHDLGELRHFTGLVHYACWSHAIDLLLHLGGAQPATITALADPQAGTCMGSDNVAALSAAIRLDNGATGALIGSCHLDFKLPLYELTLAYTHGRIHLRDLDGDLEFLDYRTTRQSVYSLPREVSRWDQYRTSFAASLEAYLASIRQAGPPPVPGLAGLAELQMEAAIRRSLAQARPVDVAAEFPLAP